MNWLMDKLLYGDRIPRVIDPMTHKALDFLTTAAFFMVAGAFWGRHKRAAATALINGSAVLAATMLTDYDGDGKRPISFPDHGKIDIAQAGMASGLPVLLGFANHPAAMIFEAQAMNEALVISATDWEATGRTEEIQAA
ncbi:MAG TPA: hypothetical protein VFU86_02535 [Terriglobales bacterium]|nr:hypothetical protein [Terriglobales bacterium]